MSESERNPQPRSKASGYWEFIVNGWPVFAAVIAVSWGIALIVADNYVTGIVEREYNKRVQSEPVIAAIRNDITAINGSLENLEGNDTEIRGQLSTVVSRLDTLISIQLQGN